MAVALPPADPDAAAERRRLEHHRRADHVFGHSAVLSHVRPPRPSASAGNLGLAETTVTQKANAEFRRVR